MDASRIARKYNKKGSAVGDLMNPVRGIRDVQRRRGIEPRNHARENIRILREKQQENRERRQQKADAKPRKFKMKRFQDVKPRVAQNDSKKASEIAKETARMRTERKEQKAKLAEKNKRIREQRIAKARENTRHSPVKSSNNRETRKPAVPKRGEVITMPARQEKNFIAENRREAVTSSPPKKKDNEDANAGIQKSGDNYGKVPLYLQERKAEMAEDAARKRRAEENKKAPAGMSLMPEEERLDTLKILKDNLAATKDHLQRMPLLVETPSAIRKKANLERKIQEIEDAINIFSRPKVFIKD
jgi:hypothetical protein|tara:strand:+ start:33 stop:938 length:906 start_codon:yes stop_codon:yes gene_type:complete|eukprot:g2048.t1